MARYRRQTRIPASLDAVWAFHSRVESVVGPDGEANPEILDVGTDVRLSMRPFGVGPRQHWTSRIVERERREGAAWFRDEMVAGPFPRWLHTHRFVDAGPETILTDVVEYDLPLLPRPFAYLGWPGFELLFADRHRRTRRLLAAERQ